MNLLGKNYLASGDEAAALGLFAKLSAKGSVAIQIATSALLPPICHQYCFPTKVLAYRFSLPLLCPPASPKETEAPLVHSVPNF